MVEDRGRLSPPIEVPIRIIFLIVKGTAVGGPEAVAASMSAAVSAPEAVEVGINKERHDAAVMRRVMGEDNDTYIEIAQKQETVNPEKKKEEQERKLRAAVRLSSQIAEGISDLEDRMRDREREISDKTEKMQRAFDDMHEAEVLLEDFHSGEVSEEQVREYLRKKNVPKADDGEVVYILSEYASARGMVGRELADDIDDLQEAQDRDQNELEEWRNTAETLESLPEFEREKLRVQLDEIGMRNVVAAQAEGDELREGAAKLDHEGKGLKNQQSSETSVNNLMNGFS